MHLLRDALHIFLQPGQYFVGGAGYSIRTLLGSCVSITLWHPRRHVGAMSHFLLPRRSGPQSAEPDGRYGEEAMQLMLREFRRLDIRPEECEAKVFGGGAMFPGQSGPGAAHVGQRNGEAARTLLREHGIRIVSENLFGVGHRQILFVVRSGEVWVRHGRGADPTWKQAR